MHILSGAQRAQFSIDDTRDPGHESDYFWVWVEVVEKDERQNERGESDWLRYQRQGVCEQTNLRRFLDHCGPKLLGAELVQSKYRRKDRDGDHGWGVFSCEDGKAKSLVCALRFPSSSLVFPKQLKSFGLTPQPGMLYLKIPYDYRTVYERQAHRRNAPPSGIFSRMGYFKVTYGEDAATLEAMNPPERRRHAERYCDLWGSEDFYNRHTFGQSGQDLRPKECLSFFNPATGAAIPVGQVPLFDLEHTYQCSAMPVKDLGENQLLLETPFRYSGGVMWEMRTALRQSMVAAYGDADGRIDRMLQELFVGRGGQKVTRSMRQLEKQFADWEAMFPGYRMPDRSPPELHWMMNPKWEIVQLLLLAYLSGGNSWLDALANLQVQADLEMPWSSE